MLKSSIVQWWDQNGRGCFSEGKMCIISHRWAKSLSKCFQSDEGRKLAHCSVFQMFVSSPAELKLDEPRWLSHPLTSAERRVLTMMDESRCFWLHWRSTVRGKVSQWLYLKADGHNFTLERELWRKKYIIKRDEDPLNCASCRTKYTWSSCWRKLNVDFIHIYFKI